jgi:Flp pilus assembly protein TadG
MGRKRGNETNAERGTITLWVLGLCICLLFLGGLSLDLWRAVAARREMSAMADAASTAGANGLDETALRVGTVRLDASRARTLATDTLAQYSRTSSLDGAEIHIAGNRVTVALRDHVDFSLLGIFMGGDHFDVEVHAAAQPEERP